MRVTKTQATETLRPLARRYASSIHEDDVFSLHRDMESLIGDWVLEDLETRYAGRKMPEFGDAESQLFESGLEAIERRLIQEATEEWHDAADWTAERWEELTEDERERWMDVRGFPGLQAAA